MLEALTPRRRALINSLAYTGLVALVTALGYLTYRTTNERKNGPETVQDAESLPLVQFDNFATRLERTNDAERISVSLRLRITAPGSLDCQVFIVARNDRTAPKIWGVWPTQGPNGALTAGGHFRGGDAKSGERVTLTQSWSKLSGSISHPLGAPAFETVMVYVIGPRGEILLTRPFALS